MPSPLRAQWTTLGENPWTSLGENGWTSLGENCWPSLGENVWTSIARKMTLAAAMTPLDPPVNGGTAPLDLPSNRGRTPLDPPVDKGAVGGLPPVDGGTVGGPTLRASEGLLENECLRLELDAAGEITSLFDKEAGRELAAGVCNNFRLYKDVPGWFDAWDIDSQYALTPVDLPEPASVEVIASGPLFAALRVTRRLHHSTLTQEVRLRRHSRRVDFVTTIDWQESHKLLKVCFPVNIHAQEAVHEIQFGHIRRPNHASRPFDADRFEVCNHKWSALMEEDRGVAVLNDCKYGLNVLGNSINLTLLKSALAPDMTADKGTQTFTYSFYAWNGPFAQSDVVREAYELNVPVLTAAGTAGECSLLCPDAANVIIEAVKAADDGSGDVIVRLYEAKRTATRCTLTTALPVQRAAETDMLEGNPRALACSGGSMALDFRPFEIKTLRLALKP